MSAGVCGLLNFNPFVVMSLICETYLLVIPSGHIVGPLLGNVWGQNSSTQESEHLHDGGLAIFKNETAVAISARKIGPDGLSSHKGNFRKIRSGNLPKCYVSKTRNICYESQLPWCQKYYDLIHFVRGYCHVRLGATLLFICAHTFLPRTWWTYSIGNASMPVLEIHNTSHPKQCHSSANGWASIED